MPIRRNPCPPSINDDSKDTTIATSSSRQEKIPHTTASKARFHLSDDDSLHSDHVLEYLEAAVSTSREDDNGTARKISRAMVPLTELSCDGTVTDSSVDAIWKLFQRNHHHLSLRILRLPRNQLTSAAAGSLANILKLTETLVHLDIRHNKVGQLGLAELIKPLTAQGGDKCSLIGLNLVDNNLTRSAAPLIAELLRKNKTLQELQLGHNPLRKEGMKAIAQGLGDNPDSKLSRIDLKATLGGKGAGIRVLITELLMRNEGIQILDLSSNNLKAAGAREFSTVFRQRNDIMDLNLGRNEIGVQGVSAVANVLNENGALQGYCHLQRLTLDWNQIGDEGATILATAVRNNSTLTFLDISNNNIGSPGATELANGFASNISLKTVLLNGNCIDDSGALALARALRRKNCCIDELTWHDNPLIPHEGEFFLNHAFRFRQSMKTWLGQLQLDMEEGRFGMSVDWWTLPMITDWEVEVLVQSLIRHNPRMLQTIWLAGEKVTDESLGLLCSRYIAENPSLQRLYLRQVTILDGMVAIKQALCTNSTLRILNVINCKVAAVDGAANLAFALKHNHTLERLKLDGMSFGDEGFRALWEVINPSEKNPHPSLVAINFNKCSLTDFSMAAIAESGSVGQLQEIYLEQNQITDRGVLDLAKAIVDNDTLRKLSLAHNMVSYKGQNTLRMFCKGICKL
jgi:NLR family CARD domain-containing protein 3